MVIDISKGNRGETSSGPVPVSNPLALHPQVKAHLEQLIQESDSSLDRYLLSEVWREGKITARHRRTLLLWRMRNHFKSHLFIEELLTAMLSPGEHDTPARRSMALINGHLDSIMEVKQLSADPADDRAVIWGEVSWDNIANGFLESSTFSTKGIAPHDISIGIPVALSSALMRFLHPARHSNAPRIGNLGERLDAHIIMDHQEALYDLLRENRRQLSAFLNFDCTPKIPEEITSPWRNELTPGEAKALFLLFDKWMKKSTGRWLLGESTSDVICYYMENAGYFTLENMKVFADLIMEYNEEWAIAAMEWE